MKIPARLHSVFAAACLGLCSSTPAVAQAAPVKPEDASRHFNAVSKHLELGGIFFSYIDIDGDLAKLSAFTDRFVDVIRKEVPEIPGEFSIGKVVDALGLTGIKAIGMSSRSLGKDLYHNRALLYTPEGPKGLLKLFGGKPAPFQIGSFAPADAGFAMQTDLHLSCLLEVSEAIVKSLGRPELLSQYRTGLAFPVPGLNMSAGDFIGKLNTRLLIAARFEDGKTLDVPGAPFAMPAVRVMLALDDIDFIMEPLVAMLGESGNAVIEKEENYTIIRPETALPGDLGYFQPALYHDKQRKRIILTSHLDMARQTGSGQGLGGTDAFKQATAGLPSEGNGLSYMTPEFLTSLYGLYERILTESVKERNGNRGEEVMKLFFEAFPRLTTPVAGIHTNVPEGLLFMSNLNENHKHTLVQLAVVPPFFIAGMLGGYKAVAGAPAEARRARENPQEDTEPRTPGSPSTAIKSNLQQIAFAAQSYFLDNPASKEVTYETLVKSELIFDLDAVAGESYKGLTLKRAGGEIEVKTKGGQTVSHEYPSAAE